MVRTFVDTMTARGTDHYGPVHSPLFAAMLDLDTLELPVQSLPDDFFKGDAPAAPDLSGYEAITGADDLLWGLLQLHCALNKEPHQPGHNDVNW